jgi:DNA processing protein
VSLPEWFDRDDERTARAVWSRITEPGDRVAVRFVERLGAGQALEAVLGGGTLGAEVAPRWRVRLDSTGPRLDRRTLARFDGRVLVPGDEEWPDGLDDLDDRRPFCLWVRGPLPVGRACTESVAVVGSRASTDYGETMTREIAGGLARRRVSVVSGAAYGIDGAAHRAALAEGGATVAVLACGVDRPYPSGHDRLIARIAAEGAVVSEVPPASSPSRWRFVERNRLIAAMSRGTVVVEAALRSGAIITATQAELLSRPVGAVPGPVVSPASAGCHWLLRDRNATCVTDAAEVRELIAPIGRGEVPARVTPRADHDDLSPTDIRVLDAVPARRSAPFLSIARAAGLDTAEVAAALGRLELSGLIVRIGESWRRAPRR